MTKQEEVDLRWWRAHIAYAVNQRRQMRWDFVIRAALLLLGVTSGTATLIVAQVPGWLIISVVACATPLIATGIREWKRSETNYSNSLRIRRAGLEEAARRALA